jgi:hypothetical protein
VKYTGRSILAVIAVLAILSAIGGGTAQAATPLQLDRGLPTANLNNAAGALRSNVSWSNGNDYVSGDDFTIGATGQVWVVTQIRTWSVAGPVATGPHNLGDMYSDVTFYTGNTTGSISVLLAGTLTAGSNSNSNSKITHTQVTYVGGLNYQGTSGSYYYIWQNDFTPNWVIDGGVKQYFAVDGTPRDPVHDYWFNHASNAALSVSPQQGSDGKWIAWAKSDLATANLCDSSAGSSGVCNGGWDKSSDINVQVFAYQVIVPSDKAACKQDGWKGLFMPTGEPFKNLGDCIQFVNTGK